MRVIYGDKLDGDADLAGTLAEVMDHLSLEGVVVLNEMDLGNELWHLVEYSDAFKDHFDPKNCQPDKLIRNIADMIDSNAEALEMFRERVEELEELLDDARNELPQWCKDAAQQAELEDILSEFRKRHHL